MVDEFENAISADRFQRFVVEAKGDRHLAIAFYRLNLGISAEFLPGLHLWEVCLRNRLDAILVARYGPQWPSAVIDRRREFKAGHIASVRKAVQIACNGRFDFAAPRGRVITELGAGFWVAMLSRAYASRLGLRPSAADVLPNLPNMPIEETHRIADRIRMLRNRIAHHEPVIWVDLQVAYEDLGTMLGGMSQSALACFDVERRLSEIIRHLRDLRDATDRAARRNGPLGMHER
jgi:hypothetical protein